VQTAAPFTNANALRFLLANVGRRRNPRYLYMQEFRQKSIITGNLSRCAQFLLSEENGPIRGK